MLTIEEFLQQDIPCLLHFTLRCPECGEKHEELGLNRMSPECYQNIDATAALLILIGLSSCNGKPHQDVLYSRNVICTGKLIVESLRFIKGTSGS